VFRVFKAQQEFKALLVFKGLKVIPVRPAFKAFKAQQVFKAHKAQ
jgi:hypothetical protein